MSENKWLSGKIKQVNPERKTGIIKQYDGKDVVFNFVDVDDHEDATAQVRKLEGKKVLYNLEETNIGQQAKKIMIMDND